METFTTVRHVVGELSLGNRCKQHAFTEKSLNRATCSEDRVQLNIATRKDTVEIVFLSFSLSLVKIF